ncbi:cytochrome c oxidase assembly protein COX18, mitochondrial-like [Rhagoletis pomonella]|uniref:cytochrome c oxidase assembly protein COX18, mitochondrial-like n=1 Tax=Rhagoletis pomonella TaxID=28610 RepID=UPI0017865F1D|nr:cytochrome c oxidase assembly protein COX18, mitochondrial-like [Rhagoletis pomonella]
MNNFRILRCKNAIRSFQSPQFSICERSFSYISSTNSLRKQMTDASSSTTSNAGVLRLQHRGLAETATNSTAIITEQVQSPFTGIWLTLSQSAPVGCMQEALTAIHDYSGLPWWASIVMSTMLFRTIITLPLAIYQNKIMARLELLALEMPAIVAELKKEAAMAMKKFNWTESQTRLVYNRSLKKQWNALIVRDNCHPAKTFIMLWGQIPLWICQSVALRNLVHMMPDPTTLQAQIIYTEMTIGGFGWIPNLTEVDSSYILPVSLALINLGIIELQTVLRTRPTTRLQKYATNVFRLLTIALVPVACSVPSALCVYWVASSCHGLAQNLLLASPVVRRSLGIPLTNSEVSNPYERMWVRMQTLTTKTEQKSLEKPSNVTKSEETRK